jgi:hypothetical protein
MTRSGFGALPSVGVGNLNYLLFKRQTLTFPDELISNELAISVDARERDAPRRSFVACDEFKLIPHT